MPAYEEGGYGGGGGAGGGAGGAGGAGSGSGSGSGSGTGSGTGSGEGTGTAYGYSGGLRRMNWERYFAHFIRQAPHDSRAPRLPGIGEILGVRNN